jgi:hypothetical protein
MVKISRADIEKINCQVFEYVTNHQNCSLKDIANGAGLALQSVRRSLFGRRDGTRIGFVETGKVIATIERNANNQFCYRFRIKEWA